MKTVSVFGSISRKNGGLFESGHRLHRAMAALPDTDVAVCGLKDEFTDADLPAWAPVPTRSFEPVGWKAFGYAPDLKKHLLALDADILQTHGLWQYPSVAVSAWHRKFRRPYLISPQGMLDPWAIQNSAWKKRLAGLIYEREHLENAGCIRALCESEAVSVRQFGLKNPICIIPNGTDLLPLPETPERAADSPFSFARPEQKVLLYLGRLHPKKGLVNLLEAWKNRLLSHTAASDWVLAIAGWDQSGHEAQLRQLSAEAGLDQSVFFMGPQFAEAKTACYRACDAFILPSFSEGLPLVVLEAWAHAKLVVMTPECNLPEGFAAEAAIRIDPAVESIASGLEMLVALSDRDRVAMGMNGYRLLERQFTTERTALQMREVYSWLLGGPRPASVAIV